MKHVAVAVLVAVLAGCGASGTAAPTAPTGSPAATAAPTGQGFNATDVMFLQMMVPHHGQGLEMVRIAQIRPVRPEVRMLAAAIESTQANEAENMAGWLRAWQQPAEAPADSHAAHGGMPGTSAAEIATLRTASDADFERRFLNMLIAHQDDAIQMARMEAAGGANAQATGLAKQIDRSRTAQIKQMLAYLEPY